MNKQKLAYGMFKLLQLKTLHLWTAICRYHWAAKNEDLKKFKPRDWLWYFDCAKVLA